MSDGDALLRAVLDRPADDLPRLVYADWLDEHGEPERAEVIRRMVGAPPEARALIPAAVDVPQLLATAPDRVTLAVLALVRSHPANEVDIGGTVYGSGTATFARGFARAVGGSLVSIRTHLPAILLREPVERVDVTDRDPDELFGDDSPTGWARARVPGDLGNAAVLPAELYDLLTGGTEDLWDEHDPAIAADRFRYWDATAKARAPLSDALIREAKIRNQRALYDLDYPHFRPAD